MQRRIIAGASLFLLLACGGGSSFDVTVVFPDQASKDQTKTLRVVAIKPGAQSGCAALQDGSSKPGDSGYTVDDEVSIPMPVVGAVRALKVVTTGRYLFFAEGSDQGGAAILRGCSEAVAGGQGVHEITITLALVNIPCQQDGDCNDHNPCTADTCESGTCRFLPDDTQKCDDQNACSTDDHCSQGACVGTVLCDDGNPCTDDSCNSDTGCVHDNNTTPCDDSNACTFDDHCSNGTCAGLSTDCDDHNPCTDDGCDPIGGCTHNNNTAPCNDGKFCTAFDTCSGGVCVGAGDPCPGLKCDEANHRCVVCLTNADCDDHNTCTDDNCDSAGRCTNSNNTALCDDGSACTFGDHCSNGTCTGFSTDCEDHNPCTDDGCDPTSGCTHSNNTAPCTDGKFCTAFDTCSGGVCVGTGNPCPGLKCDEVNHRCVVCLVDADCDDNRSCTADSCDTVAGTCVHTPDNGQCPQDGVYCNGNESCNPSASGADATTGCAHSGDPCAAAGQVCNEAGKNCTGCNTDSQCDDHLSCTDDSCNTTTHTCSRTPNNSKCPDDGIYCNGSESCNPSASGSDPITGCVHSGDPCAGGGVCNRTCNESGKNCYDRPGTVCDDGVFCDGADTCDGAGTCRHAGDPCSGGADCNRTCNEQNRNCYDAGGTTCDDGQYCNGLDSCDASGHCTVHSGDPCQGGLACNHHCNEVPRTCYDPSASPCDDGVFCDGADGCDGSGKCAHAGDPCAGGPACNRTCNEPAKNCYDRASTSCDDGVYCNGADSCDGSGTCTHSGDPCASGAACNRTCNESAKNCFDPVSTPCDDGVFCDGTDTCNGIGSCTHSGNPCTTACKTVCSETGHLCNNDPDHTKCQSGTGICCSGNCDVGWACCVANDCNDNNGCTGDDCISGTCSNKCTSQTCMQLSIGTPSAGGGAPLNIQMCPGITRSVSGFSCQSSRNHVGDDLVNEHFEAGYGVFTPSSNTTVTRIAAAQNPNALGSMGVQICGAGSWIATGNLITVNRTNLVLEFALAAAGNGAMPSAAYSTDGGSTFKALVVAGANNGSAQPYQTFRFILGPDAQNITNLQLRFVGANGSGVNPCGYVDDVRLWQLQTTAPPPPPTTLLSADFETGLGPFTAVDPDGGACNIPADACILNDGTSNRLYLEDQKGANISNTTLLDTTGAGPNDLLVLQWDWYAEGNMGSGNYVQAHFSPDGGTTWRLLSATGQTYAPTAMTTYTAILPCDAKGIRNLKIRFISPTTAKNGDTDGMRIDNVSLQVRRPAWTDTFGSFTDLGSGFYSSTISSSTSGTATVVCTYGCDPQGPIIWSNTATVTF